MPPTDPARSARKLYEEEIVGHVIALRESLIRHDENLKAWTLMNEVVPYFTRHHRQVIRARDRSFHQVRHLLEPKVYASYYGDNPHEMPFEEQWGGQLTVETADRIARVHWLKEQLPIHHPTIPPRLLDLGCNDGWMLAHLKMAGAISHGTGVDLAPDCLDRARQRVPGYEFYTGFAEDVPQIIDAANVQYDAVTCFEVMEHVLDPAKVLVAAAECLKPGGWLYFSTPNGAIEWGDINDWDNIESKGHVRAVTAADVRTWVFDQRHLFDVARVKTIVDEDGLLLTKVQRRFGLDA